MTSSIRNIFSEFLKHVGYTWTHVEPTVSSHSSHQPHGVFLAQFSLYVHKGGLKAHSFHFYVYFIISSCVSIKINNI